MARFLTDDIDMFTAYPDSLIETSEKFFGDNNAEQDLKTDFANVLMSVFPDVSKHECFGMDTRSMCDYIENETHFKILDVVYYKRVAVDEMCFLFGKRVPSIIDKTPECRLSVLKELMCANYKFKVVYAVYSTKTSTLQGNCFESIFDAVHSCTSLNTNTCQIIVMSVVTVNLSRLSLWQDVEREFLRKTRYARQSTEYEMRDKSDYEKVMLLTIRVDGNVCTHTDFLYGPYPKDFLCE